MLSIVAVVIVGGLLVGLIVLAVRRGQKQQAAGSEGADLIAYLLLAIAVGTMVFSLSRLGRAAFPSPFPTLETRREVALALAGLIVATPVTVILWRRQATRRVEHPASSAWTVYLALIEAVFMTALVIAAHQLLTWLFEGGVQPIWTDVLVFGGVIVWHEWAARSTPPASDAADLPRVVGSVIGLFTASIGVGGLLTWLLEQFYSTITPFTVGVDPVPFLAMALIGSPVWYFRWLYRPRTAPATPSRVLTVAASVLGLATALGALSVIVINLIIYLVTPTPDAARHFEFVPVAISTAAVGAVVWAHHRRRIGAERTEPLRSYHYSMAALGLATAVVSATGLATMITEGPTLAEDIVGAVTALIIALAVWLGFWRLGTAVPRGLETASISRRFYLVGGSLIAGLTSAFALIAALVILIQQALDVASPFASLAFPASLFVFSGLATWHLLRHHTHDRRLVASPETVTPFNVTLICSHPGVISTLFPNAARLRVVYRGDEAGTIDQEMAARIVDAVGNRSSLVWVDESGFRVAPAR